MRAAALRRRPRTWLRRGTAPRKALEPSEEERLLADLHLFVETALLGQITYAQDIGRGDFAIAEQHAPAVGGRDAVDDADQRRFAGSVGSEQAVDRTARNGQRDIVQRRVPGVMLADMFNC